MKELFDCNINVLEKRDHALAADILAADASTVEVQVSKSGLPVPSAASGDARRMLVHSRIDPVREAERFVAETGISGKDLVVVLGFGFGYHVEALAAVAGKGVNIIVAEQNASMVRAAFMNRDMTGLLSMDNVFLIVKPDEDKLAAVLKGRASRNVVFMIHRGTYQLDQQYWSDVLIMMKSFISTKDVNIATLARFEKTWCSNISRNIGIISAATGANIFFDRFGGMPAIVAAAGPSLTASLDFIKKNTGRCVIVAVDTSYKILTDYGIVPHFCMSVDPQLINARYFEGSSETDTVLVADPTVHPSVFRFFRGRRAVTGIAFDMMKWIEDICGRKGDLAHGGSVSTSAYDFAKRLGASPVIMVGQDLAFTSGLAHARGSHLDEQVHNRTWRFMNAQMSNRRQLTYLPPVFVDGARGGRVRTTQKMLIFRNWFENRNDGALINATANGVMIHGIPNVPHSAINIPGAAKDPFDVIDDVFASAGAGAGPSEKERMRRRVAGMSLEVGELLPVFEKALALSGELAEMIESGMDKSNPGRMGYILSKLADADAFIESREKSRGILSFAMQRVIHTITEGYETGAAAENAGTRSVFLYSGMVEAARFTARLLEKMKVLLSKGDG